ncbi:MAG: type II secretion system minor pseudopilin GspK [Sulfuricaulis sp.]|nr:type II secretion system minor pseudopilin GspK [Sulfuricaulis sp.]
MEPPKLFLNFRARHDNQAWRAVPLPCAGTGSRQRGLALITALLIMFIATTAVIYMAFNQSVWMFQGQNLIDRAQADAVAYKYIQFAMDVLSENAIKDEKNGVKFDHDKADWNQWSEEVTKPGIDKDLDALGGTLLSARITDAQAKFNLNNIMDWQKIPPIESAADKYTMEQILALNKNLVNAMLDWIDSDSDTRPNSGAEDIEYMNVAPPGLPYPAANQPFTSVDELRLVKGFDAAIVSELENSNLLAVLPTKMNGGAVLTPVNVNTASDEVLLALFTGLSPTNLATFTGGRPYKTINDVGTKPPVPLTSPGTPPTATKNYGVSTFFFEVDITVKIGKVPRRTLALIYRPARPARPQIVQISYRPPERIPSPTPTPN